VHGPRPHVDGDPFWGLVRSRRRGPLAGARGGSDWVSGHHDGRIGRPTSAATVASSPPCPIKSQMPEFAYAPGRTQAPGGRDIRRRWLTPSWRSTLGPELRLPGGLVRPTPHRRSSSSPVEGSKQDPIDNPDWPIIVLSDHDPPVSDAVGCTDPKDLALEPDRLPPGHHYGPVGSDPASAPDELTERGRLKGCTGCE
jgi:hypothetical protein